MGSKTSLRGNIWLNTEGLVGTFQARTSWAKVHELMHYVSEISNSFDMTGDKVVCMCVHAGTCMYARKVEKMLKKQPETRPRGFLNTKLRSCVSSGRRLGNHQTKEIWNLSYSFKQRNERIKFCFRKTTLANL